MNINILELAKLTPALKERLDKLKDSFAGKIADWEKTIRNIDEEKRIPDAMAVFIERWCDPDKKNKIPTDAIRESVQEDPTLYMKLPLEPKSKSKIPDKVYNFSCLKHLQQGGYVKGFLPDENNIPPPDKLHLKKSVHIRPKGRALFIWVTFNTETLQIPISDKEKIRNELGLEHFPPDDEVFFAEIELSHNEELFIPTSLDAHCSHLFRPINSEEHKEPWGMTIHLITEGRCHPELLYLNKDPNFEIKELSIVKVINKLP